MDSSHLFSGAFGGVVVAALVWFLRAYIAGRITHDFARKLEAIKSSLALSSAAHSTATASMITRQSAAHERTMNAVELLWEDHLAATTIMETWACLVDGPVLDDSLVDPIGWGFDQRVTKQTWKKGLDALILGMNQKNQSLDTIWLEFASKLERFRILIGEKTYERCITIYMIYLRAIAILIESHQSNTYPNWRADVPLRRAVASLEDKELQGAMVDQSSSFVILCTLARSRLAGFLAAVMRGEELSELTHSKAIELASTQAITRSPREGDSGQ